MDLLSVQAALLRTGVHTGALSPGRRVWNYVGYMSRVE